MAMIRITNDLLKGLGIDRETTSETKVENKNVCQQCHLGRTWKKKASHIKISDEISAYFQ
jgi:hypothetical protein